MHKEHFDEFMEDLLQKFHDVDRVKSTDIPGIDLYMDQVTTFMDDHLGLFKRSTDDKILTKTMINNYSKYNLLPPTVKKKYTNDHIVLMLFIYYLKPILSIMDIKELLGPVKDMFMGGEPPQGFTDLKDLHDRIIEKESEHFDVFEDRMRETLDIAKSIFEDVEDEDQKELLSIFATSYLFTIQASAQKFMITSLIDDYLARRDTPDSKGDKKSKDKKKASS